MSVLIHLENNMPAAAWILNGIADTRSIHPFCCSRYKNNYRISYFALVYIPSILLLFELQISQSVILSHPYRLTHGFYGNFVRHIRRCPIFVPFLASRQAPCE